LSKEYEDGLRFSQPSFRIQGIGRKKHALAEIDNHGRTISHQGEEILQRALVATLKMLWGNKQEIRPDTGQEGKRIVSGVVNVVGRIWEHFDHR
jgi:hypothetical protein